MTWSPIQLAKHAANLRVTDCLVILIYANNLVSQRIYQNIRKLPDPSILRQTVILMMTKVTAKACPHDAMQTLSS
jgi:hypothetical protein